MLRRIAGGNSLHVRIKGKPGIWAATVALLALPAAADARATAKMPVDLVIPAGCQVTTRPLDFGTVTIANLPADATSVISLRCAPGTAYVVQLDNGLHASGTQRRMYAGPVGAVAALRYVTYNLYRDAARSQVWTAQTGQVVSGIAPADGLASLTVYGRMPMNVVLPTGYRDTVTVTVSF